MGGKPSHDVLKEPPEPTATYTPKTSPKHDEIESKLGPLIKDCSKILLWKTIPMAGAAATFANYSCPFFDYVNALTTVIDILTEDESIDAVNKLMSKKIKEEIAREKLCSIKSKILTIESRLKEIVDDNLAESDRRSHAIVAANTCEEILCEFDNDESVLWNIGITSSSILIPFSTICAQVIQSNYQKCTNEFQSKKMKGQLLSVLEDYKKQCVLARSNFVTVTMEDSIVHREGLSLCVHTYQLGNSRFENESDQDLDPEGGRSYHCKDTWDNWEVLGTSYALIILYRTRLISSYRTDFYNAIKTVQDHLKAIKATNEYKKKSKKFCQDISTWRVAAVSEWVYESMIK